MLPKRFKFSAKITSAAIALASLMLWASSWQWERYLYKEELVKTYAHHHDSVAKELPISLDADVYQPLLHQKVRLRGSYDLENQLIVINRRHATGSGYWLLAPFRIAGSETAVIVSRGFIPFEDRTPESWRKYDRVGEIELVGVLQESISGGMVNPSSRVFSLKDGEDLKQWRYPDVAEIAKGLPYPVVPAIFVQRLGPPLSGEFPAEAISIRVPPSTHYWYSFEWIGLALATLLIAFLLQAFPRKRPDERDMGF